MHYSIEEITIESELAAKPTGQTNKAIISLINALPYSTRVLDYGCGKLRYAIPLANRVSSVVAIDSIFQVDKKQQIGSSFISPRDYHKDNLLVCDLDDPMWKSGTYDIVLCTNVLSAIPFDNYRIQIIKNAYEVLNNDGLLMISIQYRNSYFSTYKNRKDVVPYNDGWLIKRTARKYAFYGIPSDTTIINWCYKVGFQHCKVKYQDGTYLITAQKRILS